MAAEFAVPLPSHPRIVFMGTPDYAVPSLESLVHHGHTVAGVVTQPDRCKGRSRRLIPSPVKQSALKLGIPVFQPERVSDGGFCEQLTRIRPHILVVIAFGQILSETLLNIARWGGLNIHASLLPKYRGAAPIQRAIINGETRTGLTAMRMEKGLDSGPVLLRMETAIGERETAGKLHDRLSILSADVLLKTLKGLSSGDIQESPQDHTQATFAPKINRHTGRIPWDQPAFRLSCLARGLDPWPGAYTTLFGKTLKLFSAFPAEPGESCGVPGETLAASKEGLRVGTGAGILGVEELQMAGKKRMPAADFMRGGQLKPGVILGT